MAQDALTAYSAKRRFEATPEPGPVVGKRAGPLLFCVQRHQASRLHYDLRLELDGVLLSWAVPKGPSLDPKEKRLAMRTEDHPLAYAAFEGVIPPKQYGAGEMRVWDCGVYSPDEGKVFAWDDRAAAQNRIRTELAAGKVSFTLRGARLKGSFALVKTKEADQWLLIKHRDRFVSSADPLVDETSVLGGNGATLATLAPNGPATPIPAKLLPMLADSADAPFRKPGWIWEPKLDGHRTLAILEGERVTLRSRRGIDVSAEYPHLVAELAQQQVPGTVLDGEIVAFDAQGRPSFNALQAGSGQVAFCAFDILFFAGVDLRGAACADRRRYLAQCLLPSARVQRVHGDADGTALLEAALATGFEGVMGKRLDARYDAGKRTSAWVKVKPVHTAEFVVGGFTQGKGSRGALGSLLVGTRRGRKLEFASHVGSGFDTTTLAAAKKRLEPLVVDKCPFTEVPELNGPTTWVNPQLVAEVAFHGLTDEKRLRAPVFVRFRDDVAPIGPRTKPGATGILDQLAGAKSTCNLEVEGHRIALSNLDRVYWPAHGKQPPITKRDFLAYLAQVAPFMLPHLADRPLTMIRMPSGIAGQRFFQKHWEQAKPAFVETVTVFSGHREAPHEYLLCNNLATLLWVAQAGTLEFHIWPSRAKPGPDAATQSTDYASSLEAIERSVLNYPDYVLFDIDPYIYSGKEAKGAEPELNTRAFEKGKEVAFRVRELLNGMGLEPIVKTSGKTGLHVFLPIRRRLDFDAARHVSEMVGRHLVRLMPDDVTVEWSIPKRTGKIFMDYNMNVRGKTLNVAYSPRGEPGAPVSMPLTWDELVDAHPLDFRIPNAIARLEKTGDRWERALQDKQDLEGALARASKRGE